VANDIDDVQERPTGLALPQALPGWFCDRVTLEQEDKVLVVKFRKSLARDWIEIIVSPLNAQERPFRRLEHCQVRYRGNITDTSEETRLAIKHIIDSLAESVERALQLRPGVTIPEALGRSTEARSYTFGRDALLHFFGPYLPLGVPVLDGWALSDIYPTSQMKSLKADEPQLILDFRNSRTQKRILFTISERHPDSYAHAMSAHLTFTPLFGFGDISGTESLQAFLAFMMQLHDHDKLTWTFPAELEIVVAPRLPVLTAAQVQNPQMLLSDGSELPIGNASDVLNLSIISECSQSCAFCSVKETQPAVDGGDDTFNRLTADLLANRRRGMKKVRFNGYDPLSYSRIVDVMKFATGLGYETAQIFSPCTMLADRAFCEAVVAAAPADTNFFIPVYSMDAAKHDKVVGRPGAFDLIMKALEHLLDLVGPGRIDFLSVIMQHNYKDIADIFAFARKNHISYHAHVPYPSMESRADNYYASAGRQTDIVEAVAGGLVKVLPRTSWQLANAVYKTLEGVAPCIVFREMNKLKVPPTGWYEEADDKPNLPGTEYRDEKFSHRDGDEAFSAVSLPCPHARSCALAPACTKEILRGYADIYGVEEFRAVTVRQLVDAEHKHTLVDSAHA
jgi:molybdenum cofactor biosynthesis enzyme MoaA